ncbi:hypothetical protein EG68_09333 [Paragonimus skrjabini miyazakii]|uniref:SH2 domain-containing protein n=1 Tax=Paragonimus skrjabini miyazakii TaxID=59628 RepID=A0A8S9YBB1_9TREM|nr:hypothetical protein EG68_09333 [Paragonimus skrjabini miyazakii]
MQCAFAFSGSIGLVLCSMPLKHIEKSITDCSELDGKCKRNRYSLKKLLDRSRFSPRLLRFTRSTKSVDCDIEGDKLSQLRASSPPFTTPDCPERSSSPLDRYSDNSTAQNLSNISSLSTSECRTPVCFSNEISPNQELVEEEYEESLTDFADLILEGLRTSTKPSLDLGVENSLCEPRPLFSTCQPTANASRLFTGLSPFSCGYVTSSQITLPIDSHSIKPTSIHMEQLSSGGIYNEPCDAKPLADDVSLYPTDIYTETGCIHRTCETSVDKCSARTSKKNSPWSSAAGCNTKSLQLLPTGSGADPVGHHQSSSRSAEAVNRSTGSAEVPLESICSTEYNSSPWQHHDLSQTTSGFVDAPRGNSVIVHHPTSPFARVLRAPISTGKHDAHQVIRPPTESDSTVLTHRTAQHTNTPDPFEPGNVKSSTSALPQPADRNHVARPASKPANDVATTDPPKATDNTVKPTATNHRLQSHQSNDSHPTYEEAWDLKMTRQLGFGIPRVTPLSVTTPPSVNRVTSGVTKSTGASATVLSTQVTAETTSIVPSRLTSSGQATVETKILRERPVLDASEEAVLSELSANPACIKGGLLFHENRLFDEGPIDCPARTDTKNQESVQPSVEYDYAYNGCWSMGVRLNLSLAMGTAAPNSDPSSVNINPPGSRLDSIGAIPPAVPAHSTHRHLVNGAAGVTRTQLSRAALMPTDYDGTSTDSRDDSWDRTHGQAISELTNARFVDPTAVLPVSSVAVASSRPNEVKSSLAHSGPAGITSASGLSVLPPHQRLGGYVDPSRSDLAHQFPVGKAVGSHFAAVPFATSLPTPHWEVLPLEDQPWYHPLLTRSEAEALLAGEPEGSFLVRNSETCLNNYSLTIRHKTFLHMKISRNSNGQFILGEYSQPYTSVPQMIYRYACTKVPVQGAEFVTLVHPVCRRNN